MYDAGFRNITNIDISPVCIEQMARTNIQRTQMTWLEMDALDMSFPDEVFDMVIDKSTLDAILCGDNYYYKSAKMLMEVQRVLKTGGIYIVLSYNPPLYRMPYFVKFIFFYKLEL